MPELPEVETVRCEISPYLKGETIRDIRFPDPRNLKNISPAKFRKELKGDKIRGVIRRAKYLIFELASGKTFVIHLGMTGNLLFSPDKFVKVIFNLSHNKKLYFSDKRLFGKIWFYKNQPKFVLGPEPLGHNFRVEDFINMLKKHKSAVKPLLLNQKFIAGLGNIYAAEALFRSGINPKRPANKIQTTEAVKLFKAIQKVLTEALGLGGTSARDFVGAKGNKGGFQLRLRVYGREGKPCLKCKTPIQRIVLGQRGTYFCPKCQK